MLWFHVSKIATITNYNKFVSKNEYVEMFTNLLYKNKEELLKNDNISIKNDDMQIDELTETFDDTIKSNIRDNLNSLIESNNELINITNNIKELINDNSYDSVEKKTEEINKISISNMNDELKSEKINNLKIKPIVSVEEKQKIIRKIETKVNCNYGNTMETNAINYFEKKTNLKVYNTNIKLYKNKYEKFYICGKVDGFVDINEKTYIVEIKNRKNQIFSYIPIYEKIQILFYTKLCLINDIAFIQCINNNIDYRYIENFNNEELYIEIIKKLSNYSDLIDNLTNNEELRHAFLKLKINDKFNYIIEFINN